MKTIMIHRKNLLALLAFFMLGSGSLFSQINTLPDIGYTVKNASITFFPTNNDVLADPTNYSAVVDLASKHGTFAINSTYPFMATYTPQNGYTGADTMFYKICNAGNVICGVTSITIYIENATESNVWPGDFNNDGVVSAFDFLFISNSLHQLGKSGFNRSNVWGPYFCDNWNQSIWGIDMKYLDGDGNGVLDYNDVTYAASNFENFRTTNISPKNYAPYTSSKSMPVSAKIRNKNLVKGDTMQIDVYFGDSGILNASQRYITGAAFTVGFDSAHAVAFKNSKAWFEPNNNWITKGSGGNSIEFSARKKDYLSFEVALGRTNHLAKTINNNPGCNNLTLSLTTKDKTTANTVGEIYSSITGGNAPYTYSWSNGSTSSNITGLNISFPSAHSVTVTDNSGCTATGAVTVLDRNKNDNGNMGTLKVIIDEDIFQLSGGGNIGVELKNMYLVDDQMPEFVTPNYTTESWKSPFSSVSNRVLGGGFSLVKMMTSQSYEISLKDDFEAIQRMELVDMTGRSQILPVQIGTKSSIIHLSNQPLGNYILKMSTDRDVYHIKILN